MVAPLKWRWGARPLPGRGKAKKAVPVAAVMAAPEVDWLGLYILEDFGTGDITSDALFRPDAAGRARVVAREAMLVAGLRHAVELFARLGAQATPCMRDGDPATPGAVLLTVSGPTRAILAGERVALNLLSRMSAIASATRPCADALAKAGSAARVAATRKTTPGFRAFEKEAVALGGGETHRLGLWDAAMLKDNHLEAWCGRPLAQVEPKDVARAVAAVAAANPGRTVCCEVESLAHALAAAQAGAIWLLMDNQEAATGAAWARQVKARHPAVRIEASGGIVPANIAAYAWADRVSLGALTQKAAGKDVSLEWGDA